MTSSKIKRMPCRSHCASETFAVYKIESDNLVLSDAIEIVVRIKPQTARFAKFGGPVCGKDAHKMSVGMSLTPAFLLFIH